MAIFTKTRWPLFSLGVVAVFISLGALIGSYTREVKSTDYIQQAREAAPWIFGDSVQRLQALVFALLAKGFIALLEFGLERL